GATLLAVALAAAVGLLSAAPAVAQSVQLVPFGGQTFTKPYYVIGDPDDASRVFVVEGTGDIRLVKNGVTQSTPFLTIPEVYSACNACGLFSRAFAPDYATSGLFYVAYTRDTTPPGGPFVLRIEEFRRSAADPDVADPSTRRIVLEVPNSPFHHGGQLQTGP